MGKDRKWKIGEIGGKGREESKEREA